ncbi:alpha/beta fold hydrolase [Nitratireductor sp. GISD-1A_MAKvit]|uniref:alpha/beta fold hydrolase n=1 Tax=Nitratireductor sp. GISD-1A_MAKvit TaxID=3234198 RepID=UPI003465AFD6
MSGALYADDTGEGDSALVLLHGFAGSHRVWNSVRKRLPNGLRIVAYDLPGHGRSVDLPGAGRAKATAQAIIDDLAIRGIARTHMAGHSFGGAVAVLVAHFAPQTVSSLALLAPGGMGPEIAGDLMMARAFAGTNAEIAAAMHGMFGPQGNTPAVSEAEATALNTIPGQREKLIEIAQTIVRDGRQGAFPRSMLEALSVPVHIAWGAEDVVLPPHQAMNAPGTFILHMLEGCGHMLPEEKPDDVARIIMESMGVV